MLVPGLGFSLLDAAALAQAYGAGARVGFAPGSADIIAPSGLAATPQEAVRSAFGFVSFGNQAVFPEFAALAPVLDAVIQRSAGRFMLACLANPLWGRFVYQGHLFARGRLLGDAKREFSEHLSGRTAIIPYEAVIQGPAALARRINTCREQGMALALIDAADETQCNMLAPILAAQALAGGAAWAAKPGSHNPQDLLTGPIAILSGALDRQSLFQLGAAREKLPFRQITPAAPDIDSAIAWGAAQTQNFVISISAAPEHRGPPALAAAELLANIAAGLAATGLRRFVLAGSDSAAQILRSLNLDLLTMQDSSGGLPWFRAEQSAQIYNFLLKPGGFGADYLYLGQFEPQIRLNAAAE